MPKETEEQIGYRSLQKLLVYPNDGLALHELINSFSAAVKADPSSSTAICEALEKAGRKLCSAAMASQAMISTAPIFLKTPKFMPPSPPSQSASPSSSHSTFAASPTFPHPSAASTSATTSGAIDGRGIGMEDALIRTVMYGIISISKISEIYISGYEGLEDVGFWSHHILKPSQQLTLVYRAYLSLMILCVSGLGDTRIEGAAKVLFGKKFRDVATRKEHLELVASIRGECERLEGGERVRAGVLVGEVRALEADLGSADGGGI